MKTQKKKTLKYPKARYVFLLSLLIVFSGEIYSFFFEPFLGGSADFYKKSMYTKVTIRLYDMAKGPAWWYEEKPGIEKPLRFPPPSMSPLKIKLSALKGDVSFDLGNPLPWKSVPPHTFVTATHDHCKKKKKTSKQSPKQRALEKFVFDKILHIFPSEDLPYQFYYAVRGYGKQSVFLVAARGDLDCNGVFSEFRLQGSIDKKGRVVLSKLASQQPYE